MSLLALEKNRQRAGPVAALSPSNPVSVVYRNPAPSAIGGVIGTQIFNSAAAASEVVADTVRVGGVTAGICTALQFVGDSYSWVRGGISAWEVGRRAVKNTTVNGSSVVGGTGGAAVGGAIGTAIFPGTGTVVGSIAGGVCGSIGIGKLVNDRFDDWWRGYKVTYVKDGNEIRNLSLQYFGYSARDFQDTDIVNNESVAQRYKEYAKVYHPDKGGSKEEWITLVNHFAIVSDAIRKRDRALPSSHKGSEASRLKRRMEEERAAHEQERAHMQQEIERLQRINHKYAQREPALAGFEEVDLM